MTSSAVCHGLSSSATESRVLTALNDLVAEDLAIYFGGHVELEWILNCNLVLVNHLRRDRLQHLLSFDTVEQSLILDIAALKDRLDTIHALSEVLLVRAREREQAAWVDTDSLDCKLLGREVTALNKECLIDIVRDSWVELDLNLEALLSQYLASHVAALDHTLP